jgi:hypothetical protein
MNETYKKRYTIVQDKKCHAIKKKREKTYGKANVEFEKNTWFWLML